jgi:hypothetical protein
MAKAKPRNRKPKRCLTGLGEQGFRNKRNVTDRNGPVPVLIDAPRKRRTVRSTFENNGDETVSRLIPNDTEPARISDDKSCVLLSYDD